MADQTLLAKARKARFDDLPNFSGHPSEDVEHFLKSIKNITKATEESESREILEIVRGKLTKLAGIWFDNNESNFKKWSEFETAFRNRYFSTTIIHKKFDKLKQRKQLQDESVTSYYDDVVNLCREIDANMSDQMIIQHLMSGINPDFRKELSRHEAAMKTLKEFLKYVKIEQDLYDTFEKSRNLSLETQQQQSYFDFNQPTIPSLTAMIKQPAQNYRTKQDDRRSHPISTQRSAYQRNSFPQPVKNSSTIRDNRNWNFSQPSTFKNNQIENQNRITNQFNNCKICGRRNHRTIDCFHKRTNGCFNCGKNHIVRDCTMPPNFQ
jgi:hypothetical protein